MSDTAHTPETGALIVLTRLDSNRVPGKGLIDLGGRPLLGRVLDRLRRCAVLDRIIVATTDRPGDDPIADFAADEGIPVFRGSAEDVAIRIYEAAAAAGLTWFVRICGDSPFVAPEVIDRVAETFLVAQPDICTNVHPRTFPIGCSAEAVGMDAMERLLGETKAPEHREHVTAWFYENADAVRLVNVAAPDARYDGTSIAVDWPEEVEMGRWILTRLDTPAEAPLDLIVDHARAWWARAERGTRASGDRREPVQKGRQAQAPAATTQPSQPVRQRHNNAVLPGAVGSQEAHHRDQKHRT